MWYDGEGALALDVEEPTVLGRVVVVVVPGGRGSIFEDRSIVGVAVMVALRCRSRRELYVADGRRGG